MPDWSVYIVRCRNGALYTGIATDVRRRIAEHARNDGRGAKYLRGKGPLELVFVTAAGSRENAQRIESRIKRLPKSRKEELVSHRRRHRGGDLDTPTACRSPSRRLSKEPDRVVRIVFAWVVLGGVIASHLGCSARGPTAETGSVIFIHPDGTSTAHWTACRMLYAGPDGRLNWDRLPHVALYRDHVKDRLTATSNAGATVHAYGVKVAAGSYGTDGGEPVRRGRDHVRSILHVALDDGLACGIVNSGTITEPGTGVFAASVASRADHAGIARAILETGPHVIMGGGEQWFLPRDKMGRHGPGVREDGLDLVEQARARGYAIVTTREELLALPDGTERVLGLFAVADTYNDHSEEELAAGNLPAYDPNAPTIAEMTEVALRVLTEKGRRFLLVVEEEGTDNFGNANNARDCLLAVKRADDAIGLAREFVDRHPNTLLVTAADSDAGGLAILGLPSDRDPQAPLPAQDDNGAPLDGRDGGKTPAFLSAHDANGRRWPFAIAWATFGDVSGGILARAEGLNAEKLANEIDNTSIHRWMHLTLFGKEP